jgi:hypothetical protein
VQVNALMQSFMVIGADRFSAKNGLPLAVQKDQLKPGTYSTDSDLGEELPVLEMKSDVGTKWVGKAAGGQHRFHAIIALVAMWRKERDGLKKETAKVTEGRMETTDVDDIDEYNKMFKPRLDALEALIGYGEQWLVILYDESEYSVCGWGIAHIGAWRKCATRHLRTNDALSRILAMPRNARQSPSGVKCELTGYNY